MSDLTYKVLNTDGTITVYDKAAEIDSQLTDIVTEFADIAKGYVNIVSEGCTTNESDATSNTTIIQGLIDLGENIMIPNGSYPINAPLVITPSYRGKIIGVSVSKSFLVMIVNEVNIIEFSKTYLSAIEGIELLDFGLIYKTQQTTNTSSAVYFKSAQNDGWGYYHNRFRLSIRNAYNGISSDAIDPVWNCEFDLIMYDIYGKAVDLYAGGQLGLIFSRLIVLNYTLRDNGYNSGITCISIKGESILIDYLNVEDWKGDIFYSEDCQVVIKVIHIERHQTTGATSRLFQTQGSLQVDNCRIIYSNLYSITNFATIFFKIGSGLTHINKLTYGNATGSGTIFAFASDSDIALTYLNSIDGITMFDGDYDGKSKYNRNIVVNGKTFTERMRWEAIPAIDVYKNEFFYKKTPTDYLGWVALANGYASSSFSGACSVNYSDIVTPSSSSDLGDLSVGDGVILNDDGVIRIVTVKYADTFKVQAIIYATYTGVAYRKATSAEVLKQFGAVV